MGRRLCLRLVVALLAPRRAPVALPQHRPPRFLLVRLDQRLGNLLLTTPLMLTLARRYPGCIIDCVCFAPNAALLQGLPFLRHVYGFAKWRLFGASGLRQLMATLRRQQYDVAFDAANPSQPSFTQAALLRLAGAGASVGYDRRGFGRLYSAPVALAPDAEAREHEIDLRLRLLQPLGEGPTIRSMAVAPPWPPPTPRVAEWLEALGSLPYVVINLGARLAQKRLQAADYATVANVCTALGLRPVLVWGPRERHLLAPVMHLASDALAAPATTLRDLACVLRGANAVVTADTGPMHLAVALGRPTCGLFVRTPHRRYGHFAAPHLVLDLKECDQSTFLGAIRAFLQALAPPPRDHAGAPLASQHRSTPDQNALPPSSRRPSLGASSPPHPPH